VHVPEFLDTLFVILPECSTRSRNSGNSVLDRKKVQVPDILE
jgi:hypothetical protein